MLRPLKDRERPPILAALIFNTAFLAYLLAIHFTQLLFLPCSLHSSTKSYYEWAIKNSKRCFGLTLVAISQLFAPTYFNFTVDPSSREAHLIEPYFDGSVLQFKLPNRTVVISNHQLYLDWVYTWSFLYLANLHDSLVIMLKEALKWAPVVGPGMKIMRFIFLKRKWAQDQKTLTNALNDLGHRSQLENDPFSLVIFPEGTLVGSNTRDENDTFAKKNNIQIQKHMLLPRTTGLLTSLRILAKSTQSMEEKKNKDKDKDINDNSPLTLIDITVGYDGIKSGDYGQDYFTIQSVFGTGVPPPKVDFHLRAFTIDQIPIGNEPGDRPPTTHEKQDFEQWLRDLWNEKDQMLDQYYKTGSLVPLVDGDNDNDNSQNQNNIIKREQETTTYKPRPCKPIAQKIIIKNATDWMVLFFTLFVPLCILNWFIKFIYSF